MTDLELLQRYMEAHYRLMRRKDFWYRKGLQEGSKILCVKASDLRKKLKEQEGK